MNRIGPRMRAIESYVSRNPGCSILRAARATTGNRNEGHTYGYAAAHRALAAGLIVDDVALARALGIAIENGQTYALFTRSEYGRLCDAANHARKAG